MTSSEERGNEVTESLAWGVDRETLSVIRRATEHLDLAPGTILALARDMHRAWPGRPDADRQRAMEAHIARATARCNVVRPQPPPPPPPTASLPPGSVPGLGFGKATNQANQYHRVYQDLARIREGTS
jgi:hypothetical protein